MERRADEILGNTNDYKLCCKCNTINWYENEQCCNPDCDSEMFDVGSENIELAVNKEVEWYVNTYGDVVEDGIMFIVS